MKKIGTASMALTFAGCLLGAGYVSGQELWQYFGSFGLPGIAGLILSICLIGLSSGLVMWIAEKTGRTTMDELIVRPDIPWLRITVGALTFLLYFAVTIVMIAGMSSLGEQLFGLPRTLCSAVAVALVMTAVYFGISGMIAIFDRAVPVLIVFTIGISVIRVVSAGTGAMEFSAGNANPLLGNWSFSSFNYAMLNMFAGIGILAPLAPHLKKKTTAFSGIALGSAVLILIALAILGALSTSRMSTQSALPMLYLAGEMGAVYSYIYGFLLFLGMFGNANATLVAAMNYMDQKIPAERMNRGNRILLMGMVAFAASLCGFSNLVAVAYPIIGYIGIASMILLAEHALWLKKHPKETEGDKKCC